MHADLPRSARTRSAWSHPSVKPLVFVASLAPLAWLVYAAVAQQLGPNPAEALIRTTGDWALRFLCLTLAVTPLRQWLKLPELARWRRMLGLFTFFYAALHFLCYAGLDMGFDVDAVMRDIPKRPFALVGFMAFLLMLPLAATSFNRAIKALGSKRWQLLHRSVYAVAVLALLHYFWMKSAKHDYQEWTVYALLIGALFAARWRRFLPQSGPPSSRDGTLEFPPSAGKETT